MDLIGSLIIACSMYSRIPVPQVVWTERRMKYALCFFPAIGGIVGAAVFVSKYLAERLAVSDVTFACVATVLPLLITGGIHMDGFLDTVDARSSNLDRERKLEILQDPHAGAFAIIGAGIYLLLSVGLFCELKLESTLCLAGCFVLSRALSAWLLVSWPKAKKDGLASTFADRSDQSRVKLVMFLWLVAAGAWIFLTGGMATGIGCGAAAVLAVLRYDVVRREFGGITGDLAGYFLQICELCLLAAVVAGRMARI